MLFNRRRGCQVILHTDASMTPLSLSSIGFLYTYLMSSLSSIVIFYLKMLQFFAHHQRVIVVRPFVMFLIQPERLGCTFWISCMHDMKSKTIKSWFRFLNVAVLWLICFFNYYYYFFMHCPLLVSRILIIRVWHIKYNQLDTWLIR